MKTGVDPAFEKLLSENREIYISQSERTRYGKAAELRPVKNVSLISRLAREVLLLSWEKSNG
jgi:hypothetical protein